MILNIAFNYVCGRQFETLHTERARKRQLILAVAVNLLLLGFFKYAGFLVGTVCGIFGGHPSFELFPAPDEIGATADRYILAEAVNRLRPEFKEVVLLFYYQGFSVAEISEMLGIAEGTVSSRLSRARTKLQEELKGDESC